MPAIGLGTFGIRDAAVIEQAISIGYRHIDTSPIYGNQHQIGQAVARSIEANQVTREELFLTTKLWDSQYRDPEKALRKCLSQLGTPYIDLYLIHWPMNGLIEQKVPMHVLWPRMEALVDKGLAKGIGVSNFNVQLLADMLTYCTIKPCCNQIQIFPRYPQTELIEFLRDNEIVPIAWSPLGRLNSASGPQAEDHVNDEVMLEMAQKYGGRSVAQILLNWGLSRGYAIIPKATSLAHQTECIEALNFSLDSEDVDVISERFSQQDKQQQPLFVTTTKNGYNVFA